MTDTQTVDRAELNDAERRAFQATGSTIASVNNATITPPPSSSTTRSRGNVGRNEPAARVEDQAHPLRDLYVRE